MTDRRLTPFSGRVALETLRGRIAAESYVAGTPARVIQPVVDLSPDPGAPRDRQLLFGAEVTVIEDLGADVFVMALADGYCGWVSAQALGPALAAGAGVTHVVSAAATHVYSEASIKFGEAMRLSLGARVCVLEEDGKFFRIAEGWIPRQHLRPVDLPEADPVAVAERLLGTPYLWGGNSRDGIDCSGLVQIALAQCGIAAAGDSDLQRAQFGAFLPEDSTPERGDLFFWSGHVAMACDAERLIHANGSTMSVAHEGIEACLARIAAAQEGGYFGRKRPF